MKARYAPNYWGRLRQFEVPLSVVQEGHLVLKPNALTTLLVLVQSAKAGSYRSQGPIVEVRMTQKTLAERSGFSKNVITDATKELEASRFIKRLVLMRRRFGEFGANTYIICNPADGEPLRAAGTNFYYRNGIRYMRMPACLVMETAAEWSLAQLSGSATRLYLALCCLAAKHSNSRFSTTASGLKSLASFSTIPTMRKALAILEAKRLVFVGQNGSELHIELLDPYTGETLHRETGNSRDDPANYFAVREGHGDRRLNLNAGNAEQVKELLSSCLQEADSLVQQSNGNVMIRCPFHADSNPSCSVDPDLRGFHCFGCRKSGPLRELMAKLCGVTPGEAIERMGQALGEQVVFRDPDSNAEAIYAYHDVNGKLVKEVIRYPGKRFLQRRPAPHGGRIWGTSGVKPILYNLVRVQFSQTVCICEGEKDCDTFNGLSLHSTLSGDMVATTSGGADSWHDKLADDLRGKRVILMPDGDEAGARFAEKVAASLQQRGIEHRIVTFREAGAKDISEFIDAGHSKEELVEKVGRDWLSVTEPELIAAPAEFGPA